MEFLGSNLKAIRRRWGENQDEFSARFGLKRSNYSRIEAGEYAVSIEMLMSLSDLTGISVNDLVRKEIPGTKIPALPIGEGGEKLVNGGAPRDVAPQEGLGDLMDIRNLAAAVRGLQLDMQRLKGLLGGFDGEGIEKLKLFEALQVIIGYLEEGLDEAEYLADKKAYLSRLAAVLAGKAAE